MHAEYTQLFEDFGFNRTIVLKEISTLETWGGGDMGKFVADAFNITLVIHDARSNLVHTFAPTDAASSNTTIHVWKTVNHYSGLLENGIVLPAEIPLRTASPTVSNRNDMQTNLVDRPRVAFTPPYIVSAADSSRSGDEWLLV